jgi:hypothetical protein
MMGSDRPAFTKMLAIPGLKRDLWCFYFPGSWRFSEEFSILGMLRRHARFLQSDVRRAIQGATEIAPDTPLRLADAVAIAFPHGGMTISGLRHEASRGRLAITRIAGKDFTTLALIQEMMEKCRVREKTPIFGSGQPVETSQAPLSAPDGWSKTTDTKSALAAAQATAQKLKESSREGQAIMTVRDNLLNFLHGPNLGSAERRVRFWTIIRANIPACFGKCSLQNGAASMLSLTLSSKGISLKIGTLGGLHICQGATVRGQNDGATVGLSWTLDKGVAEGFARGHRGIWNPSPIVITAEVYKRDVAFACAERHEAEIVVFKTSRARNQTINQIMVRAALGGWPSKRYFAGMFCAVGLRPKYHARKAFFINRLVRSRMVSLPTFRNLISPEFMQL